MTNLTATATAGVVMTASGTPQSILRANYRDQLRVGLAIGDNAGWSYNLIIAAAVNEHLVVSSRVENVMGLYSMVVREIVKIRSLLQAHALYSLNFTDMLRLRTSAQSVFRTALASSIVLTEAFSSRMKTKWTDKVSLAATLAVNAIYNVRIQDFTHFKDFSGHGVFALIREQLAVSSKVLPLYRAIVALQDEIDIDDHFGPRLRAFIVYEDDVDIAEFTSVHQFLHAKILDNVEIAIELSDPSGGGSTWAINMRNSAVTSYSGYNYNSYARVGATHYGASDDGLYELDGENDDGDPIIATIEAGTMELTGPMRTGLQSVYLALRGEGEFFLKIESDRHSTVYRAHPRPMRTTRVNLGKGWRARYLTWELTSVGQDFDLSSLEFLPFPMRRT